MTSDARYSISLLSAAAMLLLGLLARSPSILLLSIPLFVYAASLLLSYALLHRPVLDARRAPSAQRVVEGEPVHVELSVTNSGDSVPYLVILDDIPDDAELLAGEAVYGGPLLRGSTITLEYTLRPRRGLHSQNGVRALVWPVYGLAVDEFRFDCLTHVSAVPQVDPLPALVIRPRRRHAFVGPVRANTPGPGIEFYGCRSFADGDDVRRVNWRAFARHGQVYVNEYEQERMTDVIVVLDIRAASHFLVGTRSTFEPCCRAAASLASHFIRQGNRVGLLLYGRSLDWIQPASGRFHLEKIVGAITRAEPAISLAFENLAQLPLQMLPSGCQIVVVSSLAQDADPMVLAKLRARGYSVLSVYADSLDLEREDQPQDEALKLASRAKVLQSVVAIRTMESLGVHVVTWDVRRPLAAAIHASRLDRAARRLS